MQTSRSGDSSPKSSILKVKKIILVSFLIYLKLPLAYIFTDCLNLIQATLMIWSFYIKQYQSILHNKILINFTYRDTNQFWVMVGFTGLTIFDSKRKLDTNYSRLPFYFRLILGLF